jgi:hypothetical protein
MSPRKARARRLNGKKSALVQCEYLRCDGYSCGCTHNHPHAKTDACREPCKPGDHRCVAVGGRKAAQTSRIS